MTNTLHRQGSAESLRNDYVIFAHTAKGITREGSAPKLREFMRICLKYHPVNMGDGKQGNIHQDDIEIEKLIANQEDGAGAAAVFTDLDTPPKGGGGTDRGRPGNLHQRQRTPGGGAGVLPEGRYPAAQRRAFPRFLGGNGPLA